jgi:hypothetical protein
VIELIGVVRATSSESLRSLGEITDSTRSCPAQRVHPNDARRIRTSLAPAHACRPRIAAGPDAVGVPVGRAPRCHRSGGPPGSTASRRDCHRHHVQRVPTVRRWPTWPAGTPRRCGIRIWSLTAAVGGRATGRGCGDRCCPEDASAPSPSLMVNSSRSWSSPTAPSRRGTGEPCRSGPPPWVRGGGYTSGTAPGSTSSGTGCDHRLDRPGTCASGRPQRLEPPGRAPPRSARSPAAGGGLHPSGLAGAAAAQQMRLGVVVDDLCLGEAAVLELGATKHDHQPGGTVRVFLERRGSPSASAWTDPRRPLSSTSRSGVDVRCPPDRGALRRGQVVKVARERAGSGEAVPGTCPPTASESTGSGRPGSGCRG